jgi:hypothetical protein
VNNEPTTGGQLERIVGRLPQTYEEMHAFAREHGIDAVKAMLRDWVKRGQPDDLLPGFTTRAMCRAAAAGLEGIPVDTIPDSYLHTKHGADLYWHMWSEGDAGDEFVRYVRA